MAAVYLGKVDEGSRVGSHLQERDALVHISTRQEAFDGGYRRQHD